MTPDYYDMVFSESPVYSIDPEESIYYPLWLRVKEMLTDDRVFELGCGTGQLAQMIENYIRGIDFSPVAIEMAKKRNPGKVFQLTNLDNLKEKDFRGVDTVIMIEVLEHLKNDVGLIDVIPQGKRVILSVPNFMSESHVRIYTGLKDIEERYPDLIIKNFIAFQTNETNRIFLIDSYKI